MTAFLWVARFFGAVPWQAWALAAFLAAAGFYHWKAVSAAGEAGKASAYAAVEKQNEEIADAAEKARARVRLCIARDGVWNSAARRCEQVVSAP